MTFAHLDDKRMRAEDPLSLRSLRICLTLLPRTCHWLFRDKDELVSVGPERSENRSIQVALWGRKFRPLRAKRAGPGIDVTQAKDRIRSLCRSVFSLWIWGRVHFKDGNAVIPGRFSLIT
jgi:hypothetical protein